MKLSGVSLTEIPALALVCGFLLIACSNPAGGGDPGSGGQADKTALAAAITTAKTEIETVTESTTAANVPIGTKWVTTAEKAAFQNAINAAEAVNNNPSANQTQVNNQVTALAEARTVFLNVKKNGSADPVNTDALSAKITNAETARDSVIIAANAGEAAQGAKWATQAQFDALNTAITAAKTARTEATTQSAVDTAVSTLNSAITTFNGAVSGNGAGTKTTGFSQAALDALKVTANAAKTGVTPSTNGDDVPPTGTWVTQTALETLNNAITAASSPPTIDSAYLSLQSALTAFNNAKQPGTTPDKPALFNAVKSADNAQDEVAVAASKDEAPAGSDWVTQAQSEALKTVYDASLAAAGSQDATKVQIDAALSALNSAITAFNNAKTANGKGTTPDKSTLTTAIGNAESAKAGVVVAANRDGAPAGSDWVTQAQSDALKTVYDASVVVRNNNKASKVQVDAALSALNSAITAFNNAKTANGKGTGTNKITITGLEALYENGTEEVGVSLFADKPTDFVDFEPAAYGMGTVTTGSLVVPLYSSEQAQETPWAGSGSFYVAFTAIKDFEDFNIVFISKEKVAFNGTAVSKAYTNNFELPIYSITLNDYGIQEAMTLNVFIEKATAEMPGGPYTDYGAWKSAMKTIVEERIVAKISLDYTLYKNETCTQPFSGTDKLQPSTTVYCKAPIPAPVPDNNGGGDSGSGDSDDRNPKEEAGDKEIKG
jgi:hypothetical protein